jgi:hypothetical protein
MCGGLCLTLVASSANILPAFSRNEAFTPSQWKRCPSSPCPELRQPPPRWPNDLTAACRQTGQQPRRQALAAPGPAVPAPCSGTPDDDGITTFGGRRQRNDADGQPSRRPRGSRQIMPVYQLCRRNGRRCFLTEPGPCECSEPCCCVACCRQNPRYRPSMEDGHVVIQSGFAGDPQQGFFGVYDGHGGLLLYTTAAPNLPSRICFQGVRLSSTFSSTCTRTSPRR